MATYTIKGVHSPYISTHILTISVHFANCPIMAEICPAMATHGTYKIIWYALVANEMKPMVDK